MISSLGPKISIITITLNSEKYLKETILSVVSQSYKDIEYLIIDGGSTDRTLEIIQKYDSQIDQWISESDGGIADAMNKGISLATGDYILFIHSDDFLINSKILQHCSSYFHNYKDMYIFQVLLDNHGHYILSKNNHFGWLTNLKMGSCHQGQFCSKELFTRIGGFDKNLKICMDYDFLLRAYRTNIKLESINLPISVMRQDGISSRKDWESISQRLNEEKRIHYKLCPYKLVSYLYKLYWSVYYPYRKIIYLLQNFLQARR